PVGARTLLHPADDAPLGPDHQQRRQHQEDEDDQYLDRGQPPGVVVDQGGGGRGLRAGQHQAGAGNHSALLTVTRLPWPAPSSRRTEQPAEFVGSQTTRSGIAVISAGTRRSPRVVATLTLAPAPPPAPAGVAADISAAAGRAAPARFGSPSCMRPASSRLCQVASSTPVSADDASPGPPLAANLDRAWLDAGCGGAA